VFTVPEAEQTVQYLLIWIAELPLDPSVTGEFKYRIAVNEIEVVTVP
jgi:hypothetical protein